MTITNHIDYSRGPRVDHLFVVDGDEGTALMVSVNDTGLDVQLEGDRSRTKGFRLSWSEVRSAVQDSYHDGVVKLTTVRSTADDGLCPECGFDSSGATHEVGHHTCGDDEHVSRCGYCGDVIDYCQGHGEDERAEYGFAPDSDEYDARREAFESVDESTEDPRLCACGKGDWCPLWDSWTGPGKTERDERVKEDDDSVVLVEHTGTLEEFQTEMAALRQRSVGGVDILQWKHDGDPVIVVLTEEQAEQLQDLLNGDPTLNEDYPALVHLDLGLGV